MRAGPWPTRTDSGRCGLLAGGRIDHRRHEVHALGREAAAPGVLVDDVLVRRDVDAVELVRRSRSSGATGSRAESGDHLVRLGADVVQLLARQARRLPGSGRSITYFGMWFPLRTRGIVPGSISSHILPVWIMHTHSTDVKGPREGPPHGAGGGHARRPAGGSPRAVRGPGVRGDVDRRHRGERRRHQGRAVPPLRGQGGDLPGGRGARAAGRVGPGGGGVPR